MDFFNFYIGVRQVTGEGGSGAVGFFCVCDGVSMGVEILVQIRPTRYVEKSLQNII